MVSDKGMAQLATTVNDKKDFLDVTREHLVKEKDIMDANKTLDNLGHGKVSSALCHVNDDDYHGNSLPRKEVSSPSYVEGICHESISNVTNCESVNIESICSPVVTDTTNDMICNGVANDLDDRNPRVPISSGEGNHDDVSDSESTSNTINTRQALRDYRYSSVSRDTSRGNITHSEDSHTNVNHREALSSSFDDHSQYDSSDVYFEELDVKPTIVDEDIGLTLHDEQAGGRSFLCKLCGKSFAVVNDSFEKSVELHTNLHHAGRYSCSLCDKMYRWRRSLDKHIVKFHPDASPFECETCGKKYRNNYSLYNHKKLHFGESRSLGTIAESHRLESNLAENIQQAQTDSLFTNSPKRLSCQLCAKSYLNKSSLRKHMRLTHSDDSLCKCETCGKQFKNEHMLREHTRNHNNSRLLCDICKRTFCSQKRLREHLEIHNLGKPVCSICEKEFSSYDNLKRHTLLHSDEIRFLCDVCGKTFVRLDRFNKHLRRHLDEKPFICLTCNKNFRDKFSLNLHIRKHTGEKPFLCNICGKSFGNKGTLRMHISGHTGDSQYKCDICGKTFAYRTYRTAHMRIHTSEKPYKCSVCSKEFTQKSSLNFHMGSHSGEKKHKCHVCGKAFLHRNYLNVHMRSHTGEKPYKCSSCQRGFSQRSSLNTHMRNCM